MKSKAEIAWRRHLRRIIRLSRRVEQYGFTTNEIRGNPLGLVTFEMLIQSRRLAEAIDILGFQHSYEAESLTRAMLETWVNARWIRIREPMRRADRFLKFEMVDGLRLLESAPLHERPPNAQDRIKQWKRWRRAVRGMFQKGSFWGRTWAFTYVGGKRVQRLSLESRLQDVSRDMQAATGRTEIDAANRTALYFIYRFLCQPPHGTQLGLTRLVTWGNRGPIPKSQPGENLTLLPMMHAAAARLSFLGWAHMI